jgi:hypothetical protein
MALGNALRTIGSRLTPGRAMWGRAPTPPPVPFKEMGTSGTAVYGGYVQVKERSPKWTGRQKWVTASEMAVNTSIIAAGVHYFLNLVAYPSWTFQPHDEEDEESLALAEFTEHVLNDMDTPWYKIVRRACMYRFHGFGIQEWTAKHRDDGLIGFKDIESRPQQTIEQWDVDVDGTVLGVWQRSPQTGNMLGIPRDKVLYLVEDTLTDNPEGIGMFRHMASPYERLMQLQNLEMRAYERDLRGTPIARAPLTFLDRAIKNGDISQADADALVAKFEALVALQVKQSDTGLVLDSMPYFSDSEAGDQVSGVPQWGFELLSGGGVGHGEIAAAIDRVQREIARIIGVEHLMMGDMGGNRALSEDKSRNLYLIANSVLKYIASAVKQDILVPLWRLNGFPLNKMPEPKPEDVTFKNAEAITNALGKMASAGATLAPNDPVVNDIRDLLGVSRQPEDLAAQGAGQNPNAILAGLPPELQAAALGGAGAGPGGPGAPGAGGLPGLAGPQNKIPGQGGGAAPGKAGKPKQVGKKKPGLDDEYSEARTEDGSANDNARGASEADRGGGDEGTTTLDLNGEKPGGKVEVDTGLLVRILERLSGGAAANGNTADPTSGKPGDDPRGAGEAEPAADAQPGDDIRAGAAGAEQVGRKPSPGAERQPARAVAGPEDDKGQTGRGEPGAKPAAAAAGKPAAVDAATGKPAVGARGADGGPDAAKPALGKPDPVAPGQPGAPGNEPGGAVKPGAAVDPATGQPNPAVGAVDPATGQPLMPGAQAKPEPEMTPERASEILQPYADYSVLPEEEQPEKESDTLWSRLGDEKDVMPAVSDQDPMSILDDIETILNGGRPQSGDEPVEGPAQPDDGDVTDQLDADADEPVSDEEDEPQPKLKPRKRKIKRVRF